MRQVASLTVWYPVTTEVTTTKPTTTTARPTTAAKTTTVIQRVTVAPSPDAAPGVRPSEGGAGLFWAVAVPILATLFGILLA